MLNYNKFNYCFNILKIYFIYIFLHILVLNKTLSEKCFIMKISKRNDFKQRCMGCDFSCLFNIIRCKLINKPC